MNIKYRFNNNETVSNPLTDISLFASYNGDLYPFASGVAPIINFQRNIELINNRISGITKELTYWDLYKLVAQVKKPLELDSIYAGLIPGQACVISCESFINNGQPYHRGDVIVKMLNGEAAYIPTLTSGVFVPNASSSGIGSDGNFKIVFDYKEESSEQSITLTIASDSTNINDSYVYGIYDLLPTGSTYLFDNYIFNEKDIHPIIKFFTEQQEEIALDFTAEIIGTGSNSQWQVNIPNERPSNAKWIQIK